MDKYRLAAAPARFFDRAGLRLPSRHPVHFVIEKGNWSIKWDGTYIAREVEKIRPGTITVDVRPYLLADKIVHFGSQYQCVSWYPHLARSNRMVCTFFHGKREDDAAMARHVDQFMSAVPRLEKVITAASLIERRLLEWGVPRKKLVRIPIGIDCSLFRPFSGDERRAARRQYGIRDDQLVIGSFQKDGNGWGEGNDPKLIKGPDVLVEVVREVAQHRPVLVFLTGPARGYVKSRLDALNIPYIHEYLDDYLALPPRFAPLDIYLNPSREEGGPKGIFEAMASGVPVVSTKVGMAPDIIRDGENGALCEVGDVAGLADAILKMAASEETTAAIIAQARVDALALDWQHVGRQHFDLVYKDLL